MENTTIPRWQDVMPYIGPIQSFIIHKTSACGPTEGRHPDDKNGRTIGVIYKDGRRIDAVYND